MSFQLEKRNRETDIICGTPNYIAPEILSGGGYSFEVDIWSLGVLIYTLIIGAPPFETKDINLTYKKIKKVEYIFPEDVSISNEAKHLISIILVADPHKRPALDEILEHNFFNHARQNPDLIKIIKNIQDIKSDDFNCEKLIKYYNY